MTLITREEVLKIARMSHIHVREDEIEPLVKQLEQVLTYARRVVTINFDESESLDRHKQVNVMRADIAVSQDVQPILAQAPEREGDFFVVQAILDTK
jgi:aspartyl/glutamyl-tRNA(Asn/Gln) amidotransferase C subunit